MGGLTPYIYFLRYSLYTFYAYYANIHSCNVTNNFSHLFMIRILLLGITAQ